MLIAEFDLSQGMMLAGVALLVFLMMRRHRQYQRQIRVDARRERKEKARAKAEAKETVVRASQPLMDAPDSILKWHVEMHETARELQGQLDSKMRSLQILIAQANVTMSQLQKAAANLQKDDEGMDERLPDDWEEVTVELPTKEKCSEIYSLHDEGNTADDISGQVGIPVGDIELILSLRTPGLPS